MENDWIPLETILEIPESIKCINCDTRDFHTSMSEHVSLDIIDIHRINGKIYSEPSISRSEILPWLKEIRALAQQDNIDSCLGFNVDRCEGWLLKYIRIHSFRDEFIVCNRKNQVIDWRACNINTAIKW